MTLKHQHKTLASLLLICTAATFADETGEAEEYPIIEGGSGTIDLRVDAANNKIGSIKTSGADIVLHNYANGQPTAVMLQDASVMSGGTLTLSFSATRAASTASSLYWGSSGSTETAFQGASLSLNNVKVVLNQVEGDNIHSLVIPNTDQRYGLTLYKIASVCGSSVSWSTSLEVNAPLLEKYFTNYRFGSDLFYHIDPIPYPVYPDYNSAEPQASDAETPATTDAWGEIIIRPYPYYGNITVEADRELNYYGKHMRACSLNGQTGMAMAGQALGLLAPQLDGNRETLPDLARVMDALDACVANAANRLADRLTAALAGASVTAPSSAAMGDLERQLRTLRNHAASLGGENAQEPKKWHQIWLNVETDYRRLGAEDMAAGFSLNSWGGSFGLDFAPCPHVVVGVSSTVMYGNLQAKGPETYAGGDLDTTYVSLYARYAHRSWHHTLLATAGRSDITLARTVDTGFGGYHTQGSTAGHAWGVLYELSKNIRLAPTGKTFVQPLAHVYYRRISVGAYTEKGSDAALRVGRSTMEALTLGVGARLQTQVGTSFLNRHAQLELRAILKSDTGDHGAASTVSLTALPEARGTLYGAETSATAIELGAGVSIPTGRGNGAVFIDASWESRRNDPDLNATIGYRLAF